MKYLLILLIPVLLACNPERRLQRIAQKYNLVKIDNLNIIDTVRIDSVRVDTTFLWSQLTDTLIMTKERLKVTILRSGDTVRVSGKCDSIFVYKEIKVPYEKIVIQSDFWDKYGNWLIFILFAILFFLLVKKLSK